jgi:hypothetical protein
LLGPAVSQPFLGQKCCFWTEWSENSTFGAGTAEEGLDVTSYMSYTYAEGRTSR